MNDKKLPSFFEQVKNLSNLTSTVVTDMMEGKEVFVSEDIQKQRMEICNSCSHNIGGRCELCGCFLEGKTKISSSQCPIMKWNRS